MQTRSTNSASITRQSTRRAASDSDATARITKETRRGEYERKRSEIEVKTANLPPHTSDVSLMAAPGTGAGTIGTTEALQHKAAMNELNDKYEPEIKKLKNIMLMKM